MRKLGGRRRLLSLEQLENKEINESGMILRHAAAKIRH